MQAHPKVFDQPVYHHDHVGGTGRLKSPSCSSPTTLPWSWNPQTDQDGDALPDAGVGFIVAAMFILEYLCHPDLANMFAKLGVELARGLPLSCWPPRHFSLNWWWLLLLLGVAAVAGPAGSRLARGRADLASLATGTDRRHHQPFAAGALCSLP